MKRYLFSTSTALMLAFAFLFSCSDDNDLKNAGVTAVRNLYEPANNKALELKSNASPLYFEWEGAKAEDAGMVLYEVIFDKENGDFSNPIYRIVSENNGLYNHVNISHKDLNRIASFAGIKSAETGKVKWTVVSSKGINEKLALDARVLEITRLPGFATIPDKVYVAGAASETGADATKALIMKSTSEGEFEIYTKLSAGSIDFVDAASESANKYYADKGVLKEGTQGSSVEAGVYRIRLDYNIGSATLTKITKLDLFFAPTNTVMATLDYVGKGEWSATNVPIVFKAEDWGRDERYKFKMAVEQNGESTVEAWGSTNMDNNRPNASTPVSYFKLVPVINNRWDYSFKFADEIDNSISNINVYFGTAEDYYHKVTKVSNK